MQTPLHPSAWPRHVLARACLAAGLSTASAVASAAAVLLSDPFDSGPSPLWRNETGNWTVSQDGTYGPTQPSTLPRNAHSSLPFELADFALDFDVRDVQDGGVWLRSAAASTGIGRTGLLLVLGGMSGTGSGLYFHEVVGNSYGAILGAVGGLFTPGVSDAHIQVSVVGDLYKVFVDHASTPTATWTSSRFDSGEVALYGYWPRAGLPQTRFDNVVLSAAPVPEPATWPLVAAGLASAALFGRRAKRRPA